MESGHEGASPHGRPSGHPVSAFSESHKLADSATAAVATAPDEVQSQPDVTRSESLVPPYWRHSLAAHRLSQASLDGAPQHLIALEDHTEDPASDTSKGLWAHSVTIDDYVIVKGSTGIGAYVVWNCKIQTLQVRSNCPFYYWHPRTAKSTH
jgi:hypothetical protein